MDSMRRCCVPRPKWWKPLTFSLACLPRTSRGASKGPGKGALVFLYFEIVLVFRKILGHGDQLIADLVPPLEGLVRPRTHGTRGLILRLALSIKTRAGEGEQSDRNQREPGSVQRSLHLCFLLWIDLLSETHRCAVPGRSESGGCALMRRKIVPHDLAVLHHEANSLELGNVGDRISSNGDEISKFPGLDRAHAVLPAQHFCGVCRDRAKNVERRQAGVMQSGKHRCRRLTACFSRIEPAHIGSSRELHSRFQYPLSETGHPLPPSLIRGGQVRFHRRGHHYARLSNLCKKTAPKRWG